MTKLKELLDRNASVEKQMRELTTACAVSAYLEHLAFRVRAGHILDFKLVWEGGETIELEARFQNVLKFIPLDIREGCK